VNPHQASVLIEYLLAVNDLRAVPCLAPNADNMSHMDFLPGKPKIGGHELCNPWRNIAGGSQNIL
jgi:hypothetical protein